jgi:hypothetical protein
VVFLLNFFDAAGAGADGQMRSVADSEGISDNSPRLRGVGAIGSGWHSESGTGTAKSSARRIGVVDGVISRYR